MSRTADVLSDLAVATAVKKLAAAQTATGDGGNLRGLADSRIRASYARTGCNRMDIRVGGAKVGAISLSVKDAPQVTDREAFEEWALAEGHARIEHDIDASVLTRSQLERALGLLRSMEPRSVVERFALENGFEKELGRGDGSAAVTADGEAVPGVEWLPSDGGTRVSGCEPAKVAAALRGLGAAPDVFGMLAGGEGVE